MKCLFLPLFLFISFFLEILPFRAEELKIAVVDMKKVFDEYEKTKTMELKLTQQMDIYKEYLAQLNQQYLNVNKQFNDARDASQNVTLNIAEREGNRKKAQQLYETLQVKEQEMKNYASDRKIQLDKLQEELRSEVLNEINRCVRNKAILAGYTVVLDSSGMSTNDISMIVYYKADIDITDSVIKDLNRGYRKDAKEPVSEDSKNKK